MDVLTIHLFEIEDKVPTYTCLRPCIHLQCTRAHTQCTYMCSRCTSCRSWPGNLARCGRRRVSVLSISIQLMPSFMMMMATTVMMITLDSFISFSSGGKTVSFVQIWTYDNIISLNSKGKKFPDTLKSIQPRSVQKYFKCSCCGK